MTAPQSDASKPTSEPVTPAAPPRKRRRWLRTLAIFAGGGLIFAAVGLGSAEYYTSRPNFCGSCHVMDPYYESYTRDVHGTKIGVLCVDCHYAPGERFTIKAKFKGLSQVASYFSGRYGAGRPRAHVADESCLRSGCHGDLDYFKKTLDIGEHRVEKRSVGGREVEIKRSPSVHFVHAKHLDVTEKRAEVEAAAAAARAELERGVDAAGLKRIETLARSVGAVRRREDDLERLIAELALNESQAQAARALVATEHRRIRVDQLAGLNCSACHAFNSTLKTHIAADRNVCYTCHFTNEEFNRNTSECLRCHEPPRRTVSIHTATSQGSQPVLMDHEDIVRRGVDCASCHLDVVRGEAVVSERECTHCHDQSRFLEEFATRTTETVRKYHEVHIAEQRAHCFDCHRAIQHGLVDPGAPIATGSGFLEPVLNDCQHCHPNHHSEQVALLTGAGSIGIANPTPNAMIGSRLNCRACHTQPGDDAKGDALIRATRETCTACHSDEYMQMFDSWKHEIEVYVGEVSGLLARIDERVAALTAAGQTLPPRSAQLLAAARANLHLVRAGGGLHNRAYALQLLDTARQQLAEAEGLLPSPQ